MTQQLPYVLPFGDAHSDRAWKAGPKAANLSLFSSAGFPVPQGFVITTDAFELHLSTNGLTERINDILTEIDSVSPSEIGRRPEALRELVTSAAIPAEVSSEIGAAYAAMGGIPVSVRSSSTLEDRVGASFAGQHDTVLNVLDQAQLWEAIRACWASLWSDRAVQYLRVMGMSARQVRMAVAVQELVKADASGVAFTIHPITGDRGQAVVYAALGLGEGTVSGEVSPDEAIIGRDSQEVVDFSLGSKTTKVVASEKGGTQYVELSAAERASYSISSEQAVQVASLALETEQHMHGVPQDVEWAFSDGRLHLLQARPMVRTSTPDEGVTWESPVPDGHWRRNWRLGEWLSGPVTPLFASWVLPTLVASREEGGTGELGWDINAHFSMPQPWFCIVNGYFYTRQDRAPRDPSRGGAPEIDRRVLMARGFAEEQRRWRKEYLPVYLKLFDEHLRYDIVEATSRDLVSLVHTLAREAGEFWNLMAIAGYGFQEMMYKPFYEVLVPEQGRPSYADLFAGFRTRTIEGQELLHSLARQIKQDEALTQQLLSDTPAAIAQSLEKLPAWLREGLQQYRDEYGHALYSLDFYYPTAGETPEVTIAMIQGYLQSDTRSPFVTVRTAARRRQRSTRKAYAATADSPENLAKLREVTKAFQGSAVAREDEAFYFMRPWPLMRGIVQELGRRLTKAGALEEPDQVFFLELQEITGLLAALDRAEPLPSLRDVAQGRKQTWEHQGKLDPPDRIPTDLIISSQTDRTPMLLEDDDGRRIQGQPASPGRARGLARVIRTPEDAIRFVKGDILVTAAASPAFTPLLLLASGLVTEAGGGASHSSLVARELGVPAVVNTGIATQVIQDGQLLELDGTRGVVHLL